MLDRDDHASILDKDDHTSVLDRDDIISVLDIPVASRAKSLQNFMQTNELMELQKAQQDMIKRMAMLKNELKE